MAIESPQRAIFEGVLKIFFKRSQARSRSDQKSKPSLFALSATETGQMTAANPNFAKRLLKGLKKVACKYGPYSKQRSGQVRSLNENVP